MRPVLLQCLWAVVAAISVSAVSTRAKAQPAPPENVTVAAQLFKDGRAAMTSGQYEKACAMFAESRRLDPQPGTLLNLAVCHEQLASGKLTTAWIEYGQAHDEFVRMGDDARAKFAQERATQLEAKLARVRIQASLPRGVVVIKIDGAEIAVGDTAAIAVPVEPGRHEVEVSAEGHKPWRGSITVSAGSAVDLTIPSLEPLTGPKPSDGKSANASSDASTTTLSHDTNSRVVLGYVAGGVGLVGLGVGTFFGLRVLSDASTVETNCTLPGGQCANASDVETNDRAHTEAVISTIGFGVGVVGIGVGTYLLLTSRSPGLAEKPHTATVRWNPVMSGSALGLGASGTW